nr:hypothetical protein [Gemmatimonadota bacterium]NIT67098.1 hypothetical protein [Gemmatimonadota bacterium]NIY35675.1 hypothetical protein [Gemmatimonadota bacterium]
MLRAFSSGLHGGAGIVLCLAMTIPVMAGPADDYEKGYAAYRRDDLMTAMQHLRIAADQ